MEVDTHDWHARLSGSRGIPLVILDLGVFVGVFLIRFLTVVFPNDHFVHLSRARQILLGDLPIRDFFDPGLFLQYYLSSAAQLLFGHNLFGEALLTIAFVAFGTTLVFHLSAQLSGSRWVAAGVTLLTVLSFPRLYGYPKVFVYVAAIGLTWLYVRRGGRATVGLMAALTAVAFLLRHDHGVYVGGMLVCFLALHEWGNARLWRRLGLYAGVTVVLLLPYAAFLQTTTGLVSFVGGSGSQAQGLASTLSSFLITPMPFKLDLSAPLWVVEPARRVNVRWAEGADDAVRQDREARYGLTAGVREGVEGQTWSYVLADFEAGNLRALLQDELVEDTAGIDRAAARVALKYRLAPGVLTEPNALAWFYYLTLFLPVVALVWVGADWWSGRIAKPEAAVVMTAAILCYIISHTLVRGSADSRLSDVAAPTFVLAAWLLGRRGGPGGSPLRAYLTHAGVVCLFLVSFWSVWTFGAVSSGGFGSLGSLLTTTGAIGGPAGVWRQLGVVNRELHRRPIDDWAPPGSTGLRAVTRYVLDCTAPSDRLLVTWFAPELFYYAERGFGGGQVFLYGVRHSSAADQRLTLERMRRQSIPIILGRRDLFEEFTQRFPPIYDHIQTRYRLAAESTFGEEQSVPAGQAQTVLVFVDTQLEPVGEHPDLGLPCYREIAETGR